MNQEIKKIIIPEGVKEIQDEQFKNYLQLEEVIFPDSLTHIGHSAFSGCKSLKKIVLPNHLSILEFDAFRNCTSLEEVTIPSSLHYIDRGVFSNCRNLKTIHMHDEINYIEDYGFYNCRRLSNFHIPKSCGSLGYRALFGCNKIKEIYIPEKLDTIERESLSLMSSLEKIVVDENNSKYLSLNDTALIDKYGNFIQYAINSKNREYTIDYYEQYEAKSKIYNIANYAFAGAKHLEKLNCISSIENVEKESFLNCPKLKKLNIIFGGGNEDKTLLFHTNSFNQRKTYFPFEEIVVPEGVTSIHSDLLFNHAKKVILPSTLEKIDSGVFYENTNLKEITIPFSINTIMANTFYKDTLIHLEGYGSFKAEELNMLISFIENDYYFYRGEKRYTSILYLKDKYFIKNEEIGCICITKEEIDHFSHDSTVLNKRPDRLVDFLYQLFQNSSDTIMEVQKVLSNTKTKNLFKDFYNDSIAFDFVTIEKKQELLKKLIHKGEFKNEVLFDGKIIKTLNKDDLPNVIANYNYALDKVLKYYAYNHPTFKFIYKNNSVDKIINFCNLLTKYEFYNEFIFHPYFINNLSLEDIELLINHYNNNIKRMFIHSKLLDSNLNNNSLNDLMKFAKVMGVFSDNKQLSQKATTFIIEKILDDTLGNGEENRFQIVGSHIHKVFNELRLRDEIDLEFIDFFIENYKELITEERSISGLIASIYNNFDLISKCSTSNRGSQKHLKVTVDRCLQYLFMITFDHVTEENKDLAKFLSKYYTERYVLDLACSILGEAKTAPRNIFSKSYISGENIIYDNDSSNDLSGDVTSGLHYEWMPKQQKENLILGKFCNCCAHLTGAGAGIMLASMIHDCCQNLVIRNQFYEIIAKATLFVNREEGYGVFNTIEANLNFLQNEEKSDLLDAITEGTNAFMDIYNKNNVVPIKEISVGMSHNAISDLLKSNEQTYYSPLDYSKFNYQIENRNYGDYPGDAFKEQRLLIKKI